MGLRWILGQMGKALISLFRPGSSASKLRRSRGENARARGAVEFAGHPRLPETLSGDDLNVAYRRAAKRVAPESTEGLLRAGNLARDVLKVHAF
jgi:hypothetical protein